MHDMSSCTFACMTEDLPRNDCAAWALPMPPVCCDALAVARPSGPDPSCSVTTVREITCHSMLLCLVSLIAHVVLTYLPLESKHIRNEMNETI